MTLMHTHFLKYDKWCMQERHKLYNNIRMKVSIISKEKEEIWFNEKKNTSIGH